MRKVLHLLFLALIACDSPTNPQDVVPDSPHSFNLREGVVRLVIGDSSGLEVDVRDITGALLSDSMITWTARDPDIATVTAEGKVHALQPGWTVVHASRPGFRDSAWVAVTPRYKSVSAGNSHACGITSDDVLYCWGEGWAMEYGGVGSSPTPLHFANGAVRIVTGWEHACRLKFDNTIWCWGRNQHGQRGDGGGSTSASSTQVSLPEPLVSISASQHHTCGLTADDRVYCWGINDTGELGIWPDPDGRISPGCSYLCRKTPVVLPDLRLRSVSAGLEHTCGLDAQGVAWCWGANESGQLGLGFVGDTLPPQEINTTLRFKSIDAGYSRTCGIRSNDELYCWGQKVSTPTRIESGMRFKAVSLMVEICALTDAGKLYCMRDGALTPLAPEVSFTSLSRNERMGCALSTAGAIYCWGHTTYTGTGVPSRTFPVMIAPPGPIPNLEGA